MAVNRIDLWLPWPPALNRIWRMHKNSIYLTPEAKQYKEKVAGIFGWEGETIWKSQMLSVSIVGYPPDRRTRDIDGILKCLLDAVPSGMGGIWADDSQIAELSVARLYEFEHRGSIRMQIRESERENVMKR